MEKFVEKMPNWLRYISAYILGILGWFIGIIIGIIWEALYGGYRNTNTIDITYILADNMAPALVSIFLGNYLFSLFIPIKNKKLHLTIYYMILLLNYGWILCNTITEQNYINLIYIITAIVSIVYLFSKIYNNDDLENTNESK